MSDAEDIRGVEHRDGGTFRGATTIIGRRFFRPLRGLSLEWKTLVTRYFVILGAFWMIIQVSSYFLTIDFRGLRVFLVVLCLSAVLAIASIIRRLWHAVPDGFEDESREAQRLAHFRPALWEYHLAYSLLKSKLSKIDGDLADLLQGRAFVEIRSKPRFAKYIRWLELRPENLIRMGEVAKHLILVDLPSALMPTGGKSVCPQTILGTIKRIEKLYRDTYEFELETHVILPPAELTAIHQIQRGWVAPIRGGIQQLTGFLERIVTLDPRRSHKVEYEIVFEEPDGIEEFGRELDRILSLPPGDIVEMELE